MDEPRELNGWDAIVILIVTLLIPIAIAWAIWMSPIPPSKNHDSDQFPMFVPDGNGGLRMLP